jgi:hypothetical protein
VLHPKLKQWRHPIDGTPNGIELIAVDVHAYAVVKPRRGDRASCRNAGAARQRCGLCGRCEDRGVEAPAREAGILGTAVDVGILMILNGHRAVRHQLQGWRCIRDEAPDPVRPEPRFSVLASIVGVSLIITVFIRETLEQQLYARATSAPPGWDQYVRTGPGDGPAPSSIIAAAERSAATHAIS